MRAFPTLVFGAPILLGTAACSEQNLQADQINVIATTVDGEIDFGDFVTFALPSELSDICLVEEEGEVSMAGGSGVDCAFAEHSRDDVVLGEVRRQLEERGYVQWDGSSNSEPDVVLFVGVVAESFLAQWYQPTIWCEGSPLFPGCWQVDYDSPHTVPGGTVLIDMAVTADSEDAELRVAWSVVLANLLSLGFPDDVLRDSVRTAFDQSPQLDDGGEP